jgi:hypothetical protein
MQVGGTAEKKNGDRKGKDRTAGETGGKKGSWKGMKVGRTERKNGGRKGKDRIAGETKGNKGGRKGKDSRGDRRE